MEVRIVFLLLMCMSWNSFSFSQNLIPNGDFEDHTGCPKEQGDFYFCKDWFVPNYSTPDYFQMCGNSSFGVPNNFMGNQNPHSINSYIGIVMTQKRFTSEGKKHDYREYVEVELLSELVKDKIYELSLYINWADFSLNSVDRIGFLLSENEINYRASDTTKAKLLKKSDGDLLIDLNLLKDKETWVKSKVEYKSCGGEKYLTLGLFLNNFNTKDFKKMMKSTNNITNTNWRYKKGIYYYVDNVLLKEIDKKEFVR